MILEIEYYKGDVKLHGKRLDARSLKRLLKSAESVCGDSGELAEMLCARFGFERIAAGALLRSRHRRALRAERTTI